MLPLVTIPLIFTSILFNSANVDFITEIIFASVSDAGVAMAKYNSSLNVIVVVTLTVLKSPE